MTSLPFSFVTFGMFIIDEIEYTDGREREQELIGGAGTYAALGARLAAASSTLANTVSWIVDVGSDFPPQFRSLIDSWGTSCTFRHDKDRLTTRAWNGYGANEHRAFKYLTSKIRLEVTSLDDKQTLASSFHMVCSPSRCIELSTKLRQRRQKLQQGQNHKSSSEHCLSDPIIVWEPIPDLCTPAELTALRFAATYVKIVSPNADELAQFFDSDSRSEMTQHQMVSDLVGRSSPSSPQTHTSDGNSSTPHVIVREGARGSTIYFLDPDPGPDAATSRSRNTVETVSISAYHDKSMSSQVVDPTGGGNTYLGALAQALSPFNIYRDQIKHRFSSSDLTEAQLTLLAAAIIATIAAGYAIEQCGVPVLDPSLTTGYNDQGTNSWNGEAFEARLTRYLNREGKRIWSQVGESTSL